jgi:hypothetical protein
MTRSLSRWPTRVLLANWQKDAGELDEMYCDAIVAKREQFTDKKADLVKADA